MTGRRGGPAWLLVGAVLLAALNLRTAVTSVGPLLDELRSGLGLSSLLAGVLTTLPVLSFAALGGLTPRVAHRVGERQALAGALLMMTAGLFLRSLVSSVGLFLVCSVAALAGGAMGNVLLPVLVKRHFPNRIGGMTAAYTTAMAIGTTAGAALAVPLASLRTPPDWRLGLGAWSVLAAAAALVWLPLSARARRPASGSTGRVRMSLRRSPTAWALTVFFAAQSLQAYVAFGWFALFFREQAGASPATAGLLLAVLAGLAIPISMVIPTLATRWSSQRPLVAFLVACYLVAYVGMLAVPRAGAWLEVLLVGVGGGAFPLALTMIGLRARTPDATAALSAFVQSVGYLLAAAGPVLVGVLHGASHGWGLPFVLLFVDLALMGVAGWYVGRPRYVEDDLAAAGT